MRRPGLRRCNARVPARPGTGVACVDGPAAGLALRCCSSMTVVCDAQPGAHEGAGDAAGAVAHRRAAVLARGVAPRASRRFAVHGLSPAGRAEAVCLRRAHQVAARETRAPTAFLLAVAALLLFQAGRAGAKNPDWPYVGNSRLLTVAGESIDTTKAASVLHGRANGRRGTFDNASFAQYYVQLDPSADPHEFHAVSFRSIAPAGSSLGLLARVH